MSDVRTVTITDCKPKVRKDGTLVSGQSNFGGPDWVMHTIMATDMIDGTPIQEDMVAFNALPVGETIQCEFKRKDDPQYGVSYTLKQVSGTRVPAVASPRDDAYEMVRESVAMALARIAALEAHCGLVIGKGQTDVPVAVQPAIAAPVTVPDDDEIPF